jgi:uncharacterized membrane protein YkvA (DUF1232 family)
MAADEPVMIELNPREQRLYDRLRTRVAKIPEPGQGSGMGDILLLLPDFTVLLTRLLRDPRVPRRSKLIALFGIGYVLSPIDLLPALLLGPLGLLDDAVVVTAALSRLINHVHPDVVRAAWPGQGDALEAIQRSASWCERFLGRKLRGFVRGALRLEQR